MSQKPDIKYKIEEILDKGISFLAATQSKNGSFPALSSSNPADFTLSFKYRSIFPTTLILSSLSSLPASPKLEKIKKKAAVFLLKQKSPHWSFNYWARGTSEAKNMPFPDDLDVTSVALCALHLYNPKLIEGRVLSSVVKLLTTLEEKEGGPYKTWLVSKTAPGDWHDTDLAVNSNIGYFLSLQNITLPNLNKFISTKINKNKVSSPYYPSIYPLIYFISRFYKGENIKKLSSLLISKRSKDGSWGNPLDTALSISSLLNFHISPKKLSKSVAYLTKQFPDGLKKPFAFCIDPAKNKQIFYSGAAPLTQAFCLEALSKYLKFLTPKTTSSIPYSATDRLIIKRVRSKYLNVNNPNLGKRAVDILDTILKKDTGRQITLMPCYFKEAFGKRGKNIGENKLIDLGTANLYGWIAYTIYDDFFDEEGKIEELSIANVALRELTLIFNNFLPENADFKKFYVSILDGMDNSNSWEVKNCRLKTEKGSIDFDHLKLPAWGNYQRLSQRSLGHGLGPLALLFYLGFSSSSKEVKALLKFFNHFLIAKQLSDDAHDFKEDLKRGHLTPVVTKLLHHARSQFKGQTKLKVLVPSLEKLFWENLLVEICHDTLLHVNLAKKALKKVSLFSSDEKLLTLLKGIESSTRQALDEQSKTASFLKEYN